jgi:hypothetical protein
VTLIAVETAGSALVPVPSIRVDGGNHPALGHPPGDTQDCLVSIAVEVLAHHGGEQLPSPRNTRVELAAIQGVEGALLLW